MTTLLKVMCVSPAQPESKPITPPGKAGKPLEMLWHSWDEINTTRRQNDLRLGCCLIPDPSGHAGILGCLPTHLVLVSPELSTSLPVPTMGSRLGNPQPRTLSFFKQPNMPQGTDNAKSWGWLGT